MPGRSSAPARLPPSWSPPSIRGWSRAPGRTTSAPVQAGPPIDPPPSTRASAPSVPASRGTSPAVSPASTTIRASCRAARTAAMSAGRSCSVPMSGCPWTIATRAVSSPAAAPAPAGSTRPCPSTGDQVEPARVAHRVAAGGERGGVLDRRRRDAAPERPVARGEPGDREVARLGGAGGEDHLVRLGPDQGRDLLAGALERLGGPAAPLVQARRAAEVVVEEREHRRAHARVERRGGGVVEVRGAGAHRPSARRRASSDGRPASRIAFWAAATS